jgi:histidyl-tRNA synthetase
LSADRSYGGRTLKRQLAAADKSGAAWSVMLLPAEWAEGLVKMKDMASGKELPVRREEAAGWLRMRKDETPS